MPQWIRGPELIIILVIVILLFGVGRLSRIGSELGRGIREFRKELRGDEIEGEGHQAEDDEQTEKNDI